MANICLHCSYNLNVNKGTCDWATDWSYRVVMSHEFLYLTSATLSTLSLTSRVKVTETRTCLLATEPVILLFVDTVYKMRCGTLFFSLSLSLSLSYTDTHHSDIELIIKSLKPCANLS